MKKRLMVLCIVSIATLTIGSVVAHADEFVWGNNATNGLITLEQIDVTNQTVVQTFSPGGVSGNGRGILAFSDNTIYWTQTGSADINITNALTHANNGV